MAITKIGGGAPAPSPRLYTCQQCGRVIGEHEQPYQLGEWVVCPECCAALQQPTPEPVAEAAKTQSYAPARRPVAVPQYQAIVVGASALYILAALVAIGATGFLCVGLTALKNFPGDVEPYEVGGLLLATIIGYGYAAILAMIGSVAGAIRDIARNSFKR